MQPAALPRPSPIEIYNYLDQNLSQGSDVFLASAGGGNSTQITPRWNVWNPPTYVVYAKPDFDTDVQKIVTEIDPGLPYNGGNERHLLTFSRFNMLLNPAFHSWAREVATDSLPRWEL